VNAQEVSYLVRSAERRYDDTNGCPECKRQNDENENRSCVKTGAYPRKPLPSMNWCKPTWPRRPANVGSLEITH
jgi:hypothetical protein